jgi:methionyl-tRNA formyltransferase
MRLIFMGTPDFAVPTLLELVGQHEVARHGASASRF